MYLLVTAITFVNTQDHRKAQPLSQGLLERVLLTTKSTQNIGRIRTRRWEGVKGWGRHEQETYLKQTPNRNVNKLSKILRAEKYEKGS